MTSHLPDEPIDRQIEELLRDAVFPASKDALFDAARDAGASNEVLSMIDGLPEQDYVDVASVSRLISGSFAPGIAC